MAFKRHRVSRRLDGCGRLSDRWFGFGVARRRIRRADERFNLLHALVELAAGFLAHVHLADSEDRRGGESEVAAEVGGELRGEVGIEHHVEEMKGFEAGAGAGGVKRRMLEFGFTDHAWTVLTPAGGSSIGRAIDE